MYHKASVPAHQAVSVNLAYCTVLPTLPTPTIQFVRSVGPDQNLFSLLTDSLFCVLGIGHHHPLLSHNVPALAR